jgi:hypothetical protein
LKDLGKGNYELMVGNHSIKGKMADLPKPLIMTEKEVTDDRISYKIKAVIKRKVMFSSRPTPLRSGATSSEPLTKQRRPN